MAALQSICWIALSLLIINYATADASNSGAQQTELGWGPWTGWSVCSATCGHGMAYRIRTCHSRDRDGEPLCEGKTKQYRICLQRNCTDERTGYRWQECSKHNTVYYGKKRYTWVPYINEAAPCELSCKSMGYGYYARFKKNVADGVICNDENTAVCMSGTCIDAGCDGVIGSGAAPDRCGACAGDGTTCRLISGIFTRTHLEQRGYNIVATIPAGARSINITEMARSRNFLALSTPTGYFLNGEMRLSPTGRFQGAGTNFVYNRAVGDYCPGECLSAPGPLNISLRVELIYFGRNPGIKYHFTVPRQSHYDDSNNSDSTDSARDDDFDDDVNSDSDNDLSDPAGAQRLSPTYAYDVAYGDGNTRRHRQSGRRRSRPRTSSYSRDLNDQAPSRRRGRDDRAYHGSRQSRRNRQRDYRRHNNGRHRSNHQGKTRSGRHRSKSGGVDVQYDPSRGQFYVKGDNGSIQYKHYYHTNLHDNIGDVPVVSSGEPDDERDENDVNKRQRPHWLKTNDIYDDKYAEFRSNTKYSSNNIIAAPLRDRTPSNGRDPPPGSTDDRRQGRVVSNTIPNTISTGSRRSGYRNDYSLYRWKISGFTDCTESCGGGLQQTRVICVKSDSQVEVIDENCDPALIPEVTTVVCNTQPCSASWAVSDWSACSVTCGRGLQKRSVSCKQRISPTLTIEVRSSRCPRRRPINRQYCQQDACFSWKVSSWGVCSTECGFGQRTRSVTCVDKSGSEVISRLCVQLKPDDEEICDMGSCAQGWFHSRWTKECSAECGRGFYTRHVYCSAADGSSLDEKKCGNPKTKPRGRKRCKASRPCGGQWFAGTWSACNATCGSNAERKRDVLCIKRHGKRLNHVVKEHNCDPDLKPESRQSCGPFPKCPPEWFVMSWSSCSKSCGTGVRTREVKCVDSSLKPSANCDKSKKPSRRKPCNTQPCDDTVRRKDSFRDPVSRPIGDSVNNNNINGNSSVSSSDGDSSSSGLQRDGLSYPRKKTKEKTITTDTVDQSRCQDEQGARWCQLARQARLCDYPHYQARCCRTCGPVKENPRS